MNTLQKDRSYLGRDTAATPIEIAHEEGSYLIDSSGKKYIDFQVGWNVGNLGWNQKEIVNQIKKFDGPNYVDPFYLYKPWADLAELLAKITPGKLTKSFRATGGTEAVEIAIQAAMKHTNRSKFISIAEGYHGHSIGAMSLGLSDFRKWYKNLLPDCYKVELPLDKKAAKKVETVLSKGDIAAFISEPIIINLGVEIPDKEFFEIVYKACKKYGTAFISDEVATGFGRTGKLFASEHYGLEPDIMCFGKALTGGYGAMGATIMTKEVAGSFEFPFSFYSTFGWHPLNVHAALTNLKFLLKRKKAILDNVNKMSRYFEGRLNKMRFKNPDKIKIKGLAIGLWFEKEGYGTKLVNRCIDKGLIISTLDTHHVTIFPALNIDFKTAKKGLDILESCV